MLGNRDGMGNMDDFNNIDKHGEVNRQRAWRTLTQLQFRMAKGCFMCFWSQIAHKCTPLNSWPMPVSLHLLSQFPLMRALGEQDLARLSQQMLLREYARRAVVVSKESAGGDLGFLVDGRLQGVDFTVDGRSVGLYFVDPGDYFGELPLIDGQAPAEYVVAAAKSTVAFVGSQQARGLITQHPEIAQAVMQRLAARVRTTMAQRTLLSLPNPFQRLCALLLQLPAHQVGNALEVSQAPTHQELAIMINASRETVTRGFQVLFLRGVLSREGQALRVADPTILKNLAQGREEPPSR